MATGHGIKTPGYQEMCYEAVRRGERCFFCGKLLGFPVICWNGSTALIFLHAHCTIGFVLRLIRDVHELEWALRIEPAGVSTQELREAGKKREARILSYLYEPREVEKMLREADDE